MPYGQPSGADMERASYCLMTYSEKLKDPRWQRKRLEILNRDEFTCCHCGDSESTLNVHHHYYEKGKSPWEYPNDALATLCESCHEYTENRRLEILKSISNPIVADYLRLICDADLNLLQCLALSFASVKYGPISENEIMLFFSRKLEKLLREHIKNLKK